MTITGAAPAHYDSNFACCGGCSSSEREDAYNGKFSTGSLVFIWNIKLKTDPQPVCLVTFPYDPTLNEQVGERRVRSGRRVGTSYPIDNDYDYLCCEQRGTCRALNEDASGKCQCVKRWGFTGDHCQNSGIVNDESFPNSTNLSSVDHLLPDLRSYLLSFDYDSAITSAATSDTSTGFLDVFETGSYRQFGWSGVIFFVLGSAFFAFLLIVHVMWKICFSNCNCRRYAKFKIYSKRQKTVWGASAFAHGILTGKRKIGHVTCFFVEIAFLLALILTGVLYTMSVMIQDGIVVLQRLEENTNAFLPSIQSATDLNRLLFDQNFVEATGMDETLVFSDTLRVPPHPTSATDDPDRFNFAELYNTPALFVLENLTTRSDEALIELFAWNQEFVTDQYEELKQLALVDSEVATPYNQTLHQDLLNSTIQQLMDPDSDGELVTANDFLEIQTVFNESWRGISDKGFELNTNIQIRWLFVAQLYYQKQKLETYIATVSGYISKIHPLLDDLVIKTQAMENAEFQLKAPVEFVTDSIRASKIADCNFNGNCAWFRSALNKLFDLFQQMVLKAERAAISCAVTAITLFLSVLCTNAFTSRMRRNVVKVYSSG
ncbi:hypothetical protein PC118_g10613 [Phytophthora cactorum]|uniref:EGF-like domain-containing protein n=1 Tax=Phytophthora cactorum TaxID=29920 RepID=A0A8T1G194_9STRA|nr:hypothetical protein PC118_g10613 [Phytophthora cactorum]